MRKLSIRVLHGLVAVGAVVMLTGANGGGCGSDVGDGDDGDGTMPPYPFDCEPGTHLETVCDDHDCEMGPNCYDTCVPDDSCPEGTVEELVCDPWYGQCPDGSDDCAVPMTYNGETPPDEPIEECYVTCVPADPCGPGFVETWICDDQPSVYPCEQGDPNCDEPPPPEPSCYPVCMPVDDCGPDYHEEVVCQGDDPYPGDPDDPQSGGGMDPQDPGGRYCETICVPNDECPPGMYYVEQCEEGPDGQGNCWGGCQPSDVCPPDMETEVICDQQGCWEECIPSNVCPPGMVPEIFCDQNGCYEQCINEDICPEGMFPEVTCDEQGCWEECFPYGQEAQQ